MSYGITVRLGVPFSPEVVERVRGALKEQGFGVLTEIDVQATLREKLGVETESYQILGACNPPLAHRALDIDREIGLLLPCNVVVRADGAEAATRLKAALAGLPGWAARAAARAIRPIAARRASP